MYKGLSYDIPAGREGWVGAENTYVLPPNALARAENIRYEGLTWRRAPGLLAFGNAALSGTPTCYAGFDWRPNAATQKQVTIWSNGNAYLEDATDLDATTLISGLSVTEPICLIEGGHTSPGGSKELYLFSKGIAPKVLTGTGTTFDAITDESVDWASNKPSGAFYHDFRMYAFGVESAPHNFYVSTLADHGDFADISDSHVFQVAPGVGDRIVAGISYIGTQAFILKYPRGIWAIDSTDITETILPTTLIRDDIGGVGPNAVCKVGSDILFVSSNGRVYSLRALRPDVDPSEADLTAMLHLDKWIEDNVDATKLKFARLVYDEVKKELWYFFTRQGSSSTNDAAIIFDYSEFTSRQTIKASLETRGEYFQAAWKRINSTTGFSELLVAGAGGQVYKTNGVSRSIDGSTAYNSIFRTIDNDFSGVDPSMAGREKAYMMLEVAIVPTGNYEMEFGIIVDGVLRRTVSINVGSGEAVFDDAEFDLDEFAGTTIAKHRVPIDVVGTQIAIQANNSNINEDFAIVYMRIYYKPLGNTYEA